MTDQWMYRVFGQEFGPLSFDEIRELAATGIVSADSDVKLGVDGKWRRAGSIGRLMAVLPFQGKSVVVKSSPSAEDIQGLRPEAPGGSRRPAQKTRNTLPSPAAPSTVPPQNAPPESDAQIVNRIRGALDSRNIPSFSQIEIYVNSGTVVVRGSVASEGERLLAIRVVKQTVGVLQVDNSLTVAVAQSSRPIAARSSPVISSLKQRRSSVPSVLSGLAESIKGEYRNHTIAGLVVTGLLGFWIYPRGPVRPVAVYPVKGRVVMNGLPLANAAIVLHRTDKSKTSKMPAYLHPHGKAEADGSFVLATFDKADGAPEGDFVATVHLTEQIEVDGETQGGPNQLPAVYAKPETSPFRVKITSSTKELQPLELVRQ